MFVSFSATFLWSTLLFLTSCFTDHHFLFGELSKLKVHAIWFYKLKLAVPINLLKDGMLFFFSATIY